MPFAPLTHARTPTEARGGVQLSVAALLPLHRRTLPATPALDAGLKPCPRHYLESRLVQLPPAASSGGALGALLPTALSAASFADCNGGRSSPAGFGDGGGACSARGGAAARTTGGGGRGRAVIGAAASCAGEPLNDQAPFKGHICSRRPAAAQRCADVGVCPARGGGWGVATTRLAGRAGEAPFQGCIRMMLTGRTGGLAFRCGTWSGCGGPVGACVCACGCRFAATALARVLHRVPHQRVRPGPLACRPLPRELPKYPPRRGEGRMHFMPYMHHEERNATAAGSTRMTALLLGHPEPPPPPRGR